MQVSKSHLQVSAQWSERVKLIIFQFLILWHQSKVWKIFGSWEVKTLKNNALKCSIFKLSFACFDHFSPFSPYFQ